MRSFTFFAVIGSVLFAAISPSCTQGTITPEEFRKEFNLDKLDAPKHEPSFLAGCSDDTPTMKPPSLFTNDGIRRMVAEIRSFQQVNGKIISKLVVHGKTALVTFFEPPDEVFTLNYSNGRLGPKKVDSKPYDSSPCFRIDETPLEYLEDMISTAVSKSGCHRKSLERIVVQKRTMKYFRGDNTVIVRQMVTSTMYFKKGCGPVVFDPTGKFFKNADSNSRQ